MHCSKHTSVPLWADISVMALHKPLTDLLHLLSKEVYVSDDDYDDFQPMPCFRQRSSCGESSGESSSTVPAVPSTAAPLPASMGACASGGASTSTMATFVGIEVRIEG